MDIVKSRKIHFFQNNSGKRCKNGSPGKVANTLCESNSKSQKMKVTDNPAKVTCTYCLRKLGTRMLSAQGEPVIRVVAMPADTNPHGDVFGGWLMSLMDVGAGTVAMRTCKGRAVTVAMDGMQFLAPVAVGDEVSVYGTLVHTGRTSMTIAVEAWRRLRDETTAQKVTAANFTFVAIDDKGRPRPVGG